MNGIYGWEVSEIELPLTPRARNRLACHERILQAAIDAVAKRGIDGLSMNRLAREVGFTPGALYRYFSCKDALIAALAVRLLEEFAEDLVEAAARVPPRQPLTRLLVLIDAYRDYAVGQPHRFGFLSVLIADPRVLVGPDHEARKVMLAIERALLPVAEALEDAVRLEQLDPGGAEDRALQLFAGVHGVLQMRKQARLAPELVDVDRLTIQLVDALLSGWGAATRRLRRSRSQSLALSSAQPRGGRS